MTKRVLIVNRCGLLSAMPTVEEYQTHAYETGDKVFGEVVVDDVDAALIFQERARIRVLIPELPGLVSEPGWRYITVVKGQIKLV